MDPTKRSLLEQLQLNEFEIARRKQLLGFSVQDASALLSCKGVVVEHIDTIVGDFYARQTAMEEIALLIGDADTLARLHLAQRAYVLSLFDGYYDLDYVNNRLRIGMVHKRIGVGPKLFLAAQLSLKNTVSAALDLHISDKAHLRSVDQALDKLLHFDTTLVFDTYIRGLLTEVELAKDRAVTYAQELEAKVAERTRQLLELAQHDSLTGLFNQRALNDCLHREVVGAKRRKKAFSLAYFDVDDFKRINDSKGHFMGDEVLRGVAEAMRRTCREMDLPFRYGGDEFCLLLPDSTVTEAEVLCQRLIEQLSTTVADVTVSIGIAQTGPDDFVAADELLRAADRKMYEAKTYPGFKICV